MMIGTTALKAVLVEPGAIDGLKNIDSATEPHGWMDVRDVAAEWMAWLHDAISRYPAGTVFQIVSSEMPNAKKVTWREG